jgi:hypothetical protein
MKLEVMIEKIHELAKINHILQAKHCILRGCNTDEGSDCVFELYADDGCNSLEMDLHQACHDLLCERKDVLEIELGVDQEQ